MANLASYRQIIADFDREAGNMFTKDWTQADDKIIEYLRNIVKPEMKVCEIGCGMGNVIESLECEQWGLDASEKMLEMCRIKNKHLGNMDAMPFPENSFDIVFMCFVLQQSLNQSETIKEAMRVLKSEGWLYIFDGDKDSAIGQEREKQMAMRTWRTCGKAVWFSKNDFSDFLTDNLMPHILIIKKQK